MLLLLAAALAYVAGTVPLAWAILIVIGLNAGFAFLQERQAGRAVEALGRHLPPQARVRRSGAVRVVPAAEIVLRDVVLLAEGDRVPADARLLSGDLELDVSALKGARQPSAEGFSGRVSDQLAEPVTRDRAGASPNVTCCCSGPAP